MLAPRPSRPPRSRRPPGSRRVRSLVLSFVVLPAVSAALPADAVALPAVAAAPPVVDARPAASRSAAVPRWPWPVAPPRLVGPYAAPPTRYAAGHRGIDLAADPATVVTAPADGVVRFVGVVVDRPVLTLDHGDGILSSYEPLASELVVGAPVARGQPLGRTASGGHCEGCLHVGARIDGEYVSPLLFFDRVPAAVLLPLGDSP